MMKVRPLNAVRMSAASLLAASSMFALGVTPALAQDASAQADSPTMPRSS
jgi:hypothetical protein